MSKFQEILHFGKKMSKCQKFTHPLTIDKIKKKQTLHFRFVDLMVHDGSPRAWSWFGPVGSDDDVTPGQMAGGGGWCRGRGGGGDRSGGRGGGGDRWNGGPKDSDGGFSKEKYGNVIGDAPSLLTWRVGRARKACCPHPPHAKLALYQLFAAQTCHLGPRPCNWPPTKKMPSWSPDFPVSYLPPPREVIPC